MLNISKTVSNEIDHLIKINSIILNKNSKIRTYDVFCGTRDNRRVTFVPFHEIHDYLSETLKNFLSIYANANSIDKISLAMAYIWLALISIHPFEDGNGRTAKYYIYEKLKENNYEISSFKEIDQLILEENTKENLDNLVRLLKTTIKRLKY